MWIYLKWTLKWKLGDTTCGTLSNRTTYNMGQKQSWSLDAAEYKVPTNEYNESFHMILSVQDIGQIKEKRQQIKQNILLYCGERTNMIICCRLIIQLQCLPLVLRWENWHKSFETLKPRVDTLYLSPDLLNFPFPYNSEILLSKQHP